MNINITYDNEFTELINTLKERYPKEFFKLEGIGEQLDIKKYSEEMYQKQSAPDTSIDANANVTDFMPATYINEVTKPLLKLESMFILWKKIKDLHSINIANNVIEMQISGAIYINDLHGIASSQAYCYNFSTLDIVNKGLPMVNKIKTVPPKHMLSFKSQLEQFIAYSSNSIMGATGIADVLLSFSYYIDKIISTMSDGKVKFQCEEDVWGYAEEILISLIYTLNQPFRSGIQSPFTNISIYDEEFLKTMQLDYEFPEGKFFKIETVNKLQNLYLDIINKEHKRTPITFPVVTACFATDDDNNIVDKDFLNMISEKNKEFGFINIYCGKSSTLSSCCRLRSDTKNEYFNSFGAGKNKIGSLGVVTINFPQTAYRSENKKELFYGQIARLAKYCNIINNAKREILKEKINDGALPLYTLGFMGISTQYSTIGINGLFESIEIMGEDILKEDGQNTVNGVLELINKVCDEGQTKYNSPHNVEQIPAESASVKLAYKDRLLGFNKKYDIYSNQFIPLTSNADLLDRIMLQGKFDSKFSGGAICHLNVDQKIEDTNQIKDLIEYSAKKGVIYFAINYILSRCENNHFTVSKKENCSICNGKIVDTYTRVVGFLVNTKNFNPIRRELDLPNRTFYGDIKCD